MRGLRCSPWRRMPVPEVIEGHHCRHACGASTFHTPRMCADAGLERVVLDARPGWRALRRLIKHSDLLRFAPAGEAGRPGRAASCVHVGPGAPDGVSAQAAESTRPSASTKALQHFGEAAVNRARGAGCLAVELAAPPPPQATDGPERNWEQAAGGQQDSSCRSGAAGQQTTAGLGPERNGRAWRVRRTVGVRRPWRSEAVGIQKGF